MKDQTSSQPRSVYYVFEFKGVDCVQLASNVEEVKQLLATVYGAQTGTVPLGYVDENKMIHLFEPYAQGSDISKDQMQGQLEYRIAKAVEMYQQVPPSGNL